MAAVASKNLYDLLGNDVEDENDVPKPPSKEIVKKTTSSKKRDEPPAPVPTSDSTQRGGYGRRGRGDGNEAAFRDQGNGRQHNRSRPTDEASGFKDRSDRPFRPSRGGGRGRGREFDRHSGMNRTDTEKRVAQGWGSNTGRRELTEEQAGENIAEAEAVAEAATGVDGDAQRETSEGATGKAEFAREPEEEPEPEPEDNTMSYAQWLAEREKKSPAWQLPEARSANEGARENSKWSAAKELVKEDAAEVYFPGERKNQKNQRQRKEKQLLEIDQRYVDPRDIRRGGGERSTRGRNGPPRGDRPTRGRGEYRGGSGGSGAGGRGGRTAGTGGALNVSNEADFPSLGGGK